MVCVEHRHGQLHKVDLLVWQNLRGGRIEVPGVQVSAHSHRHPHGLLLGHVLVPVEGPPPQAGEGRLALNNKAAVPQDRAPLRVLFHVCGDGQYVAQVHLPLVQSDAGGDVSSDHCSVGLGHAEEAVQLVDVVLDADHLRRPGVVQHGGGELQRSRRVLRHRRHRVESVEVPHAGEVVGGRQDGLGHLALLHGSVGRTIPAVLGHICRRLGASVVVAPELDQPGIRPQRQGLGAGRIDAGAAHRRRLVVDAPHLLRLQRLLAERGELHGDIVHKPGDIAGLGERKELLVDRRVRRDFRERPDGGAGDWCRLVLVRRVALQS
mmetsp:Transcript_89133/g.256958  ORF Transcript_89133/g.256958 Transcript_89133/m.256958 type:complete len:321 (+) Transcript_89133:270-1232(+)